MVSKLLVGTRKGLLVYEKKSEGWTAINDAFLGIPVNMVYVDERSGTWWVALDHGHWGMKLHKSGDQGVNWQEIEAPKYPEGSKIKEDVPASLKYIWAFAQAGEDHPEHLYIGTEPGGLFEMDKHGEMKLNEALWNDPTRPEQWFGGGRDYAGIHSIVVDPRDAQHLYVGISVAGVFESKDRGQSWHARNKGLRADFLPDPDAEIGHDPHLLLACRAHPEVMWQQNHCGIFRSEDGGQQWQDISDPDGSANFGFAIAIDDDNPLRAWVAPAISDEIRVAVDRSLCIARTDDGGQTWQYYRQGLPQEYCYDIVYRHALIANGDDVIFGTTTGNLFGSADAGVTWHPISNYLSMIYCLAWA